MKEIFIGLVTAVAAVIACQWFLAGRYPPPPVRELGTLHAWASLDDLGRPLVPATQPDPAQVALDRIIDRFDIQGKTFEKVIAELGQKTGCNFFIEWRVLDSVGIERDTTFNGQFENATGTAILRRLLTLLGGANVRLGFRVEQGQIRITTWEHLQQDVVLRAYDVRDLVHSQFDRSNRTEPRKTHGNDVEIADDLLKLIQEQIDIGSWRVNGSSVGSIQYFCGRLVITQTPENHDAIYQLLAALRRKQR